MKAIVLIDTFWYGHHSMHFKFYTKALLGLGYQVVAICPDTQDLIEYIAEESPKQGENLFTFETQDPKPSQFPIGRIRRALTVLGRWKQAKKSIQAACDVLGKQVELVFFPDLDSYLAPHLIHQFVDSIFPYDWLGLYHEPRLFRVQQKFQNLKKGFLNPHAICYSHHCLGLGVHDEGVVESLRENLDNKPVVAFPNTVNTSAPDSDFSLLTDVLKKAQGRKIIGLLGALGKRKGVLTLLKASQLAANKNYFFAFVGQLSYDSFSKEELAEVKDIIAPEPENCYFHFEFVPGEAQFNAVVDICDVLYIVNENYPSNSQVLTLAAVFEKMVIANDQFNIGERVQKYKLGVGIPERDPQACVQALERLLASKDSDHPSIQPQFDEYRQLHGYHQIPLTFQQLFKDAGHAIPS